MKEMGTVSVSIRPTPIIKGESAKRLAYIIEHPTDKPELLKKIKELSRGIVFDL